MSQLGQVRIGHLAPDFHCEAVIGGNIRDVSLDTFIRPSKSPDCPDPNAPWLLLLFIPAAFSFVCPTEVIAFQNCYDEFRDRNCSIAFVSVDTKHSLWHWQNVPRQYGGLGNIDIPLLSDATHKIGRDYGVFIEEQGVSLRGMFIIDNEGLVQQITLNNLTVGRSVLEALRLLEAFQAVAKHGVLCPVDWKPSSHASDTLNTISNTLVESYEDRLANLQKEFGDVQVTDLDVKHGSSSALTSTYVPHAEFVQNPALIVELSSPRLPNGLEDKSSEAQDPPPSPGHTSCMPRVPAAIAEDASSKQRNGLVKSGPPSPITVVATPVATPDGQKASVPPKLVTQDRTARHSRGMAIHRDINSLFSLSEPTFFRDSASPELSSSDSEAQTDTAPGHHSAHHKLQKALSAPPQRLTLFAGSPHVYESQRGSQVFLEFADPTLSPRVEYPPSRPRAIHRATSPPLRSGRPPTSLAERRSAPILSRATSWSGVLRRENSSTGMAVPAPIKSSGSTASDGQTRLQATFQMIKKMSAGLTSPRVDYGAGKASGGGTQGPGYFDSTAEEQAGES